jgi:hypothetical protein
MFPVPTPTAKTNEKIVIKISIATTAQYFLGSSAR